LAGSRYGGIALYQPVINGIGGNLVSVQASRISTQLHGECEKKILPGGGRICESPLTVFFTKSTVIFNLLRTLSDFVHKLPKLTIHSFLVTGVNSMSARLLLFLAVPGHLIFSTVTHFVSTSADSQYGALFLALYITAAVLQVGMLLYIAKILTNLCWKKSVDPDTASIPYLTALGDLFGSALLFLAFELLNQYNNA
jgi:solute carrier family 41